MDSSRIILIHGFLKNNNDMKYLEKFFLNKGFLVDNLNLPLTFSKIKKSEDILSEKIKYLLKDKINPSKELVIIGYGLGGVVLRKVINNLNISNSFIKIVLIASPTKMPKIFKTYPNILKIASKIFKPLDVFQSGDIEKLEQCDEFKLGIIAGTSSEDTTFFKILDTYNDGTFSLDEVIFEKKFELLKIPFGHNELHKRKGTAEYILDFIETGKFKIEAKKEKV
ncbi:MAG: esterase/lipase family protein [Fusobacteriaceae bacterium]